MTLPFSLFLALKYLKPKRTFLSVVTVLSTLGVLLGVAVLIIVLSVMTGFDEMWRNKILDFNAHVTVSVPGGLGEEEDSLCEQIEAVPGVTAAAPFLQSLVFIQKRNGQVETPLIRGVDPDREKRVSRIPQSLVDGEFSVADGAVVIGSVNWGKDALENRNEACVVVRDPALADHFAEYFRRPEWSATAFAPAAEK